MTEGELWSWVRSVMSQGAQIRIDYEHKTYEHYSARLDAVAAQRTEDLWARLQRRPLSDKEIEAIANSMAAHDAFTFTRAIEAAHGIKEAT